MRSTGGWFKHRGLRRFAIVVACLLGASALALAGSGKASASGGLSATWTSWLNSGIDNYGDTSGAWTSGDNAVQVPLGNGQNLWMFNDSFYGSINAFGGASPFSVHFVHNMDLLTSGSGSSFTVNATIAGPVSNEAPAPLIDAPAPQSGQEWASPAGGVASNGNVEAIYNYFYFPTGAPALHYAPVGNEIVTMPVSTITNPSTYTYQAAPSAGANCNNTGGSLTNCIQWGVSTLNSESCPAATDWSNCTYVYGEIWPQAGDNNHTLVEAVTPEGNLNGTWWYDNTNGWSTTQGTLATPLGTSNVNAVSVYAISQGDYVAVESTGGSGGTPTGVWAYYSSSPQLTNVGNPAELFTQPSGPSSMPGEIAYQFHIEAGYSSGSSVVMGFSVNGTGTEDQACLAYAPNVDIATYQPEFYSFTLPASAGAVSTGSLPTPPLSYNGVSGEQTGCLSTVPSPTSFQATYAGVGGVNLSWTDPGGLYEYNVRREDESSPSPTWTQFTYAVWDSPCSGATENNCITDDVYNAGLIPGHAYLYQLDAYNWNGASSGWDGGASVILPAKITGVNSGLCASVAYASGENGAGLDQESCIAQYAPQEWGYSPTQPDPNANYEEYQIQNLSSDYCMQPVSTALGAGIEQETCTTAAIGQWEFRVTDSNYDLELYNPGSGLCLGSSGNGQSAGTWLALITCSTASDATWDSSLDY